MVACWWEDDLVKRILLAMMIWGGIYGFGIVYDADIACSGEMTNDMKKMQEQLNNQVLSKPFSAADETQVKSYIADAQRRGEVPSPYTGQYWRPGYTFVNLRSYSYQEYLACRYYHSYYGHYYP
jgi:hypothetical protein